MLAEPTESKINNIIHLYRDKNKDAYSIGRLHGMKTDEVNDLLKRHGVFRVIGSKSVVSTIPSDKVGKMVDRYNNHNESLNTIGRAFRISPHTVAKILINAGVTLRPSKRGMAASN